MVLEFQEALRVVEAHARGVAEGRGTERVELAAARGRVLAEGVVADRDQPGFDRSTRDGFAVRAADLPEQESSGQALRVLGLLRAGEVWTGAAVSSGEAVEIMTGAPMPAGADAVLMVEHVRREDGVVRPEAGRRLRAGENVVSRGSEARAGEMLLAAGTRLAAAEIALAAACGAARVHVYERPKVAIVATGDELVELDREPEAWEIRNSNSYGLAALAAAAGGVGGRLAIARDLREDLRERIAQGRVWDLLILSGGVSMGQYDLVEEVLAEFGAEFFFTGVKMQPGKPVVFGRLPARGESPACYFFGLPGNPISTQVTFQCFAEPLLRVLGGESWSGPRWALARLRGVGEGKAGLTRLLPGRMDGVEVRVLGWQGSGDMAANARANCYVELTADRADGDVVRVLLGDR